MNEQTAAERLAEATGGPIEKFEAGDLPLPKLDDLESIQDE